MSKRSPRLKAGEQLWTIKRDEAGQWRWKCQAANYRTIDASEEGHRSRPYTARKAIRRGAPKALLSPTVHRAVASQR